MWTQRLFEQHPNNDQVSESKICMNEKSEFPKITCKWRENDRNAEQFHQKRNGWHVCIQVKETRTNKILTDLHIVLNQFAQGNL